jgi:hypothetical protein
MFLCKPDLLALSAVFTFERFRLDGVSALLGTFIFDLDILLGVSY